MNQENFIRAKQIERNLNNINQNIDRIQQVIESKMLDKDLTSIQVFDCNGKIVRTLQIQTPALRTGLKIELASWIDERTKLEQEFESL